MHVSDFAFDLPEHLIADRPVEPRDAARLLVHDRATGETWHRHVRDLADHLVADDLLVLNDTKVLPNRLIGHRASGGRVELLILERRGPACRGFVKPARKLRSGETIPLEDGSLQMVVGALTDDGRATFDLHVADGDTVDAALERVGRAPLPPYIRRRDSDDPRADRARYQTVFARRPGAVAAPTAGLHFTPALLADLEQRGVARAYVTLHVGEGTFAPIRVDTVEDHRMHAEWFEIPGETATQISAVRSAGKRVVAVGTTATRTLEANATDDRTVTAGSGHTQIFLRPGSQFRVVDALLTNFHLPESTLLMLVAGFAGRDRILGLYREAIAEGYRFYSFGDAMLLL